MRFKTHLLLAAMALIVTLMAEGAWVISGRALDGWLWTLYSPAIFVTIALSGGPHDISASIGAIAVTAQTLVMLYAVFLGIFVVSRRLGAKGRVTPHDP